MSKVKARRRTLRLDELEPYPGNAREHDLEALKASLDHHGQYRPIVVQESRSRILAGNGTYFAARDLGWPDIRCELIDVDDDQARRIVLVDNRANDLAGYDDGLLAALLEPLESLEGTGFDDQAVSSLLDSLDDHDEETDEPPPEPPVDPVARPGDVWLLGPHRLACGDATQAHLTSTLGPKANTQPPPLSAEPRRRSLHRAVRVLGSSCGGTGVDGSTEGSNVCVGRSLHQTSPTGAEL